MRKNLREPRGTARPEGHRPGRAGRAPGAALWHEPCARCSARAHTGAHDPDVRRGAPVPFLPLLQARTVRVLKDASGDEHLSTKVTPLRRRVRARGRGRGAGGGRRPGAGGGRDRFGPGEPFLNARQLRVDRQRRPGRGTCPHLSAPGHKALKIRVKQKENEKLITAFTVVRGGRGQLGEQSDRGSHAGLEHGFTACPRRSGRSACVSQVSRGRRSW